MDFTLPLLLPREKMLQYGITSLTDAELLALFLRTGTPGKSVFVLSQELLQHFGSLYWKVSVIGLPRGKWLGWVGLFGQ